MSEVQPLRLYSKSSTQTDWTCKRKYFYNYVYGGTGIVTNNTSLELFMGNAIHDSLSAIALSHPDVDIDLIAQTAYKQMFEALAPTVEGEIDGIEFVKEQATLVEGLVRGFYKHAWPNLMNQYPIIKLVEQPMIYKHDGLGFMAKPDLVLADPEGTNVYIEYKSTSSKKPEWVESWNTAVQVHSTIKAIEEFLGESVQSMIVQGLFKGYSSYGKQNSPFCYAYKRNGNPPFTQDAVEYAYKAGFKRYPTWELEGGVKKWVEDMPANILADQFPQTPPIFINNDLIDAFFRQRASREWDIVNSMHLISSHEVSDNDKRYEMDRTFPQKWEACRPAWGYSCNYRKLCHSDAGSDPLNNGFTPRNEDHQQIFRDLLKDDK